MSQGSQRSAPGGATYDGSTMHVGDGTWLANKDTFLLPNIQGLNFATLQYNGMGNRFSSIPEYQQLVTAHGIIAAITFLGIVPAAILIARFYHRDPRLALRTHITLMTFTVLLATVILILGYFAVGPERSLTNPHHGIGVAIYVLILVQAIGGAIIFRIEKGKTRSHIPMKLMLHQWVGRAIALLALAQIPIGLALYGSPLYLFILYALVMAAYVTIYFIYSYRVKKLAGAGYEGSYVSGTRTDLTERRSDSHHPGRLATIAGAVGAAGAVEALRRRRSGRGAEGAGSAVESRHDSASYLTEKYSDDSQAPREHTWRDRILGGAAGVGTFAAVKKLMNRGRDHERDDYRDDGRTQYESEMSDDRYRPPPPPLGGNVSQSTAYVNMMEEGMPGQHPNLNYQNMARSRPPPPNGPMPPSAMSGALPLSGPPPLSGPDPEYGRGRGDYQGRGVNDSDVTPPSQRSYEYEHMGPLDRLAEVTGIGGFFRRRREKKEQDRIDAQRQRDYENERMFGPQEEEPLYPGDGSPRPDRVRFDPRSASAPSNRSRRGQQPPIAPVPAPGTSGYGYEPPTPPAPPPQNLPPPPRGGPWATRGASAGPPQPQQQGQSAGPPPPPGSERSLGGASQARQATTNPANENVSRSAPPNDGVLQEPPPVASPARDRSSSSASNGNVGSPPVSLRLHMHNDRSGNVTVRRLNQEEAAMQRQSGTTQGSSQDRGQSGAYGVASTQPRSSSRLREAPSTTSTPPQQGSSSQQVFDPLMPPSQQQRGYTSSPSGTGGAAGSPSGTGGYDTGNDSWEASRKRRRAERARAQASKARRDDGGVDFS